MKAFKILAVAAVVIGAAAPQFAAAESSVVTAATGSASAKLNFKVTIPRVLFLQVGTGTALTTVATVDSIDFAPLPSELLAATPNLAGTGGDAGAGAVTVRVFANSGIVTLAATSPVAGGMQIGSTGVFVPWTELLATASAGTTAGGFTGSTIPHPVINGANATINPVSGVVKEVSKWTFAYKNTASYGPGVYTGQVTYTASAP